MEFPFVKKWQVYYIKRKIDNLTRKIFYSIFSQHDQPLEYGNVRRSDEWGMYNDNILHWVILADVVMGKPIQYIITYSMLDKKYSCYARTEKNNFSNVFQFSTIDIRELEFRLTELANHIPSLRERMLREYVYNESKNAPGRNWLRIFFGRGKTEEYLNGKIEHLYNQGKISKNEMIRLQNYTSNLF